MTIEVNDIHSDWYQNEKIKEVAEVINTRFALGGLISQKFSVILATLQALPLH